MTGKEKEILDYINFTIKNDGYSPSVREICEAVDLKSTSTVQYHLKKLEKKGVISKSVGKSRSLHINDASDGFRAVPILGEIAAGIPLTAEANKVGVIPYPESNFNDSLIALKVNGESMIDAGIHNGDLVVIDKSITPTNGDIGAFLLFDTEATIKYLDTINGIQYLIPANKSFDNIEVNENISIVGKVVSLFRDM
jgi:repressor LexA